MTNIKGEKLQEESVSDVNVAEEIIDMSDTPEEPKVETEEKTKDKKSEEAETKGPGKVFEFGDVYFYCNKCDTHTKQGEGHKGIQLPVFYATENTELKFECSKCGNVMKLYFKESSKETIIKMRAIIAASEQQTKEDGTDKENISEEPTKGDVVDTQREPESNEERNSITSSVDGVGQEVASEG
jgi:predicted  nucleic acid-binding Zn-ribbon protein